MLQNLNLIFSRVIKEAVMSTILRIFALVVKDIRLKSVNLVCIWTGLVSGSVILSFISYTSGPLPLFIFPILMSAFLSLFYMEWLISSEKEGGTFLWLRTLPVSDRAIVSSKIITMALLLAVHPLAVLPSALVNPVNLLVLLVTGIIGVSLFCGCIWGMLVFLVLKGANKYLIPLFTVLLLSLLGIIIMQKFSWMPDFLMTLPSQVPSVILIAPVSAVFGWWLTCKYFESRDSLQLVD